MATTVLADRYELGKQLGHGGMATVYEAHDGLLDRAVAVKLLRVEAQRNARERFAAEARNAASLTHPHAVAVYDVNTGAERPFIVMELVRGETLQDVLERDATLGTASVVAIGSQVLAALHAAHRRGLVHRDVKPANILLPDGVVPTRPDQLPGVKLADFGIAKAVDEATIGLTMAGQVIGTPKYLSPEQVKGERATPLSDLYATAVVLYEMLAGRPPFARESAVALALAHREDDPPPLAELRPDVDRALVALVHRGLSKDPADRPRDAAAMRTTLLRSAPSSGTQLLPTPDETTGALSPRERPAPRARTGATPRAATRPAPPPPRRRRTARRLGTIVTGILLILVLALGYLLLRDVPAPNAEPTPQEQAPAVDGDAPAGDDAPQDDGQDTGGDTSGEEAVPAVTPEPAPPAEDEPEPEPEAAPTG